MKQPPAAHDPDRRCVLRLGLEGLASLWVGGALCGLLSRARAAPAALAPLGPLGPADDNGLRLPRGFSSRILARSGEPVAGTAHVWHSAPDGGATFARADGGWIYVSNSEIDEAGGGAGALRFSPAGEIVAAYSILLGTSRNCAGGPTPWGTWLSCEEIEAGRVWECDPSGERPALVRPALGVLQHEAAVVDPQQMRLYLTEDQRDGCLYRYTPRRIAADGRPDLEAGVLEVAEVLGSGPEGLVRWHRIRDPLGRIRATRYQVAEATVFRRGEGAFFAGGTLYFATTEDERVWAYSPASGQLRLRYDAKRHAEPILTRPDNITAGTDGRLLVAEDGGDMQIVVLNPDGTLAPIVQVANHPRSGITGPAFDPSGTRLYFSSQWGEPRRPDGGLTYEVRGPFFS